MLLPRNLPEAQAVSRVRDHPGSTTTVPQEKIKAHQIWQQHSACPCTSTAEQGKAQLVCTSIQHAFTDTITKKPPVTGKAGQLQQHDWRMSVQSVKFTMQTCRGVHLLEEHIPLNP